MSGRFIAWILNEEGLEFGGELVSILLETCTDPGAFATLANMLSHGHLSALSFNEKNISTLLEIVSDRSQFHSLRGQALLVLSLITLEIPSALRLLRAYFFKIDSNDDGRYLRYAAAAIGILSSHVHVSEAGEHLTLLRGVEEAAEEASLQLGFHYLAQGFETSNRAEALLCFENAREEFKTSVSLGEGRSDAQLMYQCLTILLNFHNGLTSQVKEESKKFHSVLFEYSALLLHDEAADRLMGCRTEETYRWMLFSSRLSLLCQSFEEQTWLEAARVIEEQLFFTYCAYRSIFKRSSDGGIDTIVKPKIISGIQENNFHLASVKAWLENVDQNVRDDDWGRLYESVSKKLETGIFQNPDSAAETPSSPVADIQEGLNPFENGIDWLNKKFAESRKAFQEQLPSPAISVLIEKVLIFLGSCTESDDFLHHKDAGNLFFLLIDRIFSFLQARKHMPSSNVSSLRYLHSDFDGIVKEVHLQDDLFNYLQTGAYSTNITYEPRKHAGGRADIKVNYINVNTVIEIKKINTKMTDEEILGSYGPQASTYQVADTNFCFLGILDDYDNGGLQIDLRDSFSCHHWAPKNGATRYTVIIFRVQGKRRAPSDLSKKPKKSV